MGARQFASVQAHFCFLALAIAHIDAQFHLVGVTLLTCLAVEECDLPHFCFVRLEQTFVALRALKFHWGGCDGGEESVG